MKATIRLRAGGDPLIVNDITVIKEVTTDETRDIEYFTRFAIFDYMYIFIGSDIVSVRGEDILSVRFSD
ncbi:MAG: hypothetical protein GX451_09560 [Acholeplasmataceae bacterium]|nr:hypothetical protein [Acholeplasmataceae bacterium]